LIREAEREDPSRTTPTIIFGLTGNCKEDDLDRYNQAGMDGCIEKGCVVSRAMHEALAMKKENPGEFIFINSRNVQSFRSKHVSDNSDVKEVEPPKEPAPEGSAVPPSLASVTSVGLTDSAPPAITPTLALSHSEPVVNISETDSPSHHLAKVKANLSINVRLYSGNLITHSQIDSGCSNLFSNNGRKETCITC
jgi:hypothetical protein